MTKSPRYQNDRRIITLTGRSQSGKDTVGNYLVQRYGYHRYAFADKLKESLLALNPTVIVTDFEKSGFDQDLVKDVTSSGDSVLRIADLVQVGGWDQAKQIPQVGKLLQRMGTEAGWMIHGRDVWIKLCEDQFEKDLPVQAPVVITDMRFTSEKQWIQNRANGFSIRIERPDQADVSTRDANHISETQLVAIELDEVILNDGTLKDLYSKIDKIVATRGLGF